MRAQRRRERRKGWRPGLGRGLCSGLLLIAGVFAAAAQASPIVIGEGGSDPFLADPLYFIPPSPENPDPTGLVGPGSGPDWIVPPSAFAISACAGGGCELSVAYDLLLPVIQNPQRPEESQNPQTPQGTPTPAVPFVADSDWTVRNETSETLTGTWLLFTGVDFTGGYPEIPVALDQFVYDIVQICAGEDAAWYGALPLGTLAPGQEKTLRIRYIVAGDLPDEGGSLVAPPFGIAGLIVPEPATLPLAGAGLFALAFARRRRCR